MVPKCKADCDLWILVSFLVGKRLIKLSQARCYKTFMPTDQCAFGSKVKLLTGF